MRWRRVHAIHMPKRADMARQLIEGVAMCVAVAHAVATVWERRERMEVGAVPRSKSQWGCVWRCWDELGVEVVWPKDEWWQEWGSQGLELAAVIAWA